MQMIRHEAIDRTSQTLPCCGMEHQFAKTDVERRTQPAFGSIKQGQSPEDHGVALIVISRQPGQVECTIERVSWCFCGWLELHGKQLTTGSKVVQVAGLRNLFDVMNGASLRRLLLV